MSIDRAHPAVRFLALIVHRLWPAAALVYCPLNVVEQDQDLRPAGVGSSILKKGQAAGQRHQNLD